MMLNVGFAVNLLSQYALQLMDLRFSFILFGLRMMKDMSVDRNREMVGQVINA